MIADDLWAIIDNNPIFVQVGFNRFDIKGVTIHDDYLTIDIEDDANNPKEIYDFSPTIM